MLRVKYRGILLKNYYFFFYIASGFLDTLKEVGVLFPIFKSLLILELSKTNPLVSSDIPFSQLTSCDSLSMAFFNCMF